MKRLILAIAMSLVMVSCGSNLINGNTDECWYQTVEEKGNIIIGLSETIMLYHSKTVIYKDSTLRYIDCEDKDSVVKVIAKNFSPIKIKDIYRVTNIDTTYTNIVWYDIDENRYFFNNTTREIIMMIQLDIDGINDKTMISKYYTNVPNTIDECIKQFSN